MPPCTPGEIIVPSGPSALLTTGGVNSGPLLYCESSFTASARNSGVQSISLSAEHGRIELAEPTDAIRVGDKLEWIVGYGDTTVCLHDDMVGVRDGVVETVWPILGRGKLS